MTEVVYYCRDCEDEIANPTAEQCESFREAHHKCSWIKVTM